MSVAESGKIANDEICEQFARMFLCVSGTPLGSPELPLVKSNETSSRSPTLGRPSKAGSH